MAGRAFADGTDLPEMPLPRLPSMMPAGGDDSSNIVAELKAMRDELAALRKQTQGGQVQASQDARMGNRHLGEISQKVGPGLIEPRRQRIA
jgi:hypothetical protein